MRKANEISVRRSRLMHTWAYAIIFTIIILASSGLYLRYAWNKYQRAASSEAIQLAQSLESLFHPQHISELSGNPDDVGKPEYTMAKDNLIRLVETTNPIRFAYLMGERDGSIVFLLDSESPDSPDYSPPGQVYTEAGDIVWEAFRSGQTVLTAPTTDRWGTWISVLVPIKNPVDGSVIAVFGIDYAASEWYSHLWIQMLPDIIIVLCALIILSTMLWILFQHRALKKLNEKLAVDEELYRKVFERAPIGIAIVDDKSFIYQSDSDYMSINPMFEQILGRSNQELSSTKWPEITHPDDLQADMEKFEQFKTGKINGYSMEKRFIKPDGSSIWTNMMISPLLGSFGEHSMHLCLLEDISARKNTDESLRESERSKSILLSNLPGMAYRCNYDRNWTMQFVSDGCFELTGYHPEFLLYDRVLSYNDLITPKYREPLWKEWERILAKRLQFRYEYEIITASGEQKWVLELGQGIFNKQGKVEALEGIILDISDRKEMENNLKYINEHDTLTGLYNHRYLEKELEQDAIKRKEIKRAVASINLSAMHLLSLSYGFRYSQALFKKIAEALKGYCNNNRQLFNTYEYRFVFYIKRYQDRGELIAFCETVAKTLESLLTIERIEAGIGVIEIDESNNHDIELLLKNLLVTSEKAIHTGESEITICFFGKELEDQIIRKETIKYELEEIADYKNPDRLFLQFQPILDLKLNCICGFEALARLNSDHLGLVSPAEFIPLAEETKLIVPLGEMIIRQSFNFLGELRQKGLGNIGVTINISAIQLLRKDFVEGLFEIIHEMHANPANIGLEITESVFASNYQEINNIIGELRAFGLKIAIDDFGVRYSSLARERELNVNCLKIDKYFIDKLLEVDPDKAITGDIISMAHKLGHCVIAEGIEHEKQLKYLREHDCDRIQGYLISRPLDKKAAIELLKNQYSINNACRLIDRQC